MKVGGRVGGMAPTHLIFCKPLQLEVAGCSNWIVRQQGARVATYLHLDLCDQKGQSVIRAQIVVFAYSFLRTLTPTNCVLTVTGTCGHRWLLLC